MIYDEYKQLVHYLQGMIQDGVQLIQGGNIFDWTDTNIPDVLSRINQINAQSNNQKLESGELVKNLQTGQKSAIINSDENFVYLIPIEKTIKFPTSEFWAYHTKSEPGD